MRPEPEPSGSTPKRPTFSMFFHGFQIWEAMLVALLDLPRREWVLPGVMQLHEEKAPPWATWLRTVNQDLRFCNHHMATYATWQWKHRRALKQSEVMT